MLRSMADFVIAFVVFIRFDWMIFCCYFFFFIISLELVFAEMNWMQLLAGVSKQIYDTKTPMFDCRILTTKKKLWFLQKNPKRKVEWPCTISMLINLKWPLIMLISFSFFIAKMRYYSNAVVQPFDWHPSLRFRGGLLFTPK